MYQHLINNNILVEEKFGFRPKGTRTVQADSDSDSESRHKECPLFISAGAYSGGRLRRVVAGSRSQTVCRNDFLIPISRLTQIVTV